MSTDFYHKHTVVFLSHLMLMPLADALGYELTYVIQPLHPLVGEPLGNYDIKGRSGLLITIFVYKAYGMMYVHIGIFFRSVVVDVLDLNK